MQPEEGEHQGAGVVSLLIRVSATFWADETPVFPEHVQWGETI